MTPAPEFVRETETRAPLAVRRTWARLIRKVYEVDPLLCPRCCGTKRIIAFIEQLEAIEKILTRFGLWPTRAPLGVRQCQFCVKTIERGEVPTAYVGRAGRA